MLLFYWKEVRRYMYIASHCTCLARHTLDIDQGSNHTNLHTLLGLFPHMLYMYK